MKISLISFTRYIVIAALAVSTFAGSAGAAPYFRSGSASAGSIMAAEPYQQTFTLNMQPGYTGVNGYILIPEKKTFVVEHVSLSGRAAESQQIDLTISTQIYPDTSRRPHYFSLNKESTISGTTFYKLSQPVKLYCDYPSLMVSVSRSSNIGQAFFNVTVSGYFVDH